jgi:hypothetical protein
MINPIRTTCVRGRVRGWCLLTEEPTKFEEANTEERWCHAMDDELGSSRCTRSRKMRHKKLVKHKARLLAKGYVQEQDMDFKEVFCPIARM